MVIVAGRQPRQRQRARRGLRDDARRSASSRACRGIVVAQARSGEPAVPRVRERTGEFEPVAAQPTLASAIQIGNPVSVHKAIARAASDRRHRRAGERAGAGRRGGARRPHRHVHLPAHRRRAGGAHQAGRAGRNPARRARRRHLDRQRPEVRRLQGGLPRRTPSRALRRRRRTGPSSCPTTTTRSGGSLTWQSRPSAGVPVWPA